MTTPIYSSTKPDYNTFEALITSQLDELKRNIDDVSIAISRTVNLMKLQVLEREFSEQSAIQIGDYYRDKYDQVWLIDSISEFKYPKLVVNRICQNDGRQDDVLMEHLLIDLATYNQENLPNRYPNIMENPEESQLSGMSYEALMKEMQIAFTQARREPNPKKSEYALNRMVLFARSAQVDPLAIICEMAVGEHFILNNQD